MDAATEKNEKDPFTRGNWTTADGLIATSIGQNVTISFEYAEVTLACPAG
jgi:hypothetical protein